MIDVVTPLDVLRRTVVDATPLARGSSPSARSVSSVPFSSPDPTRGRRTRRTSCRAGRRPGSRPRGLATGRRLRSGRAELRDAHERLLLIASGLVYA